MNRRSLLLFVLSIVFLGLLGAVCEQSSTPDARVGKLEKSLSRMTARVDQSIVQLETSGKTVTDEVAGIKTYLGEVNTALEGLKAEVAEAKSADASLQKKIDDLTKKVTDLTSKVGAVDNRVWVLENRYNDHLRKYHGG